MAKYQVLQTFQDKYTEEVYKPGKVIELEDDRTKEILAGLAAYDGEFLVPVEPKEVNEEEMPKTTKKGKTKTKAKTADSKLE